MKGCVSFLDYCLSLLVFFALLVVLEFDQIEVQPVLSRPGMVVLTDHVRLVNGLEVPALNSL